ncbi:MAG: 30S ribosomal protein S8e [Candidatus Diapherotrites archaeon]
MVQYHLKGKSKPSGGIRRTLRRSDKKLAWKGGEIASTSIAPEDDIKIVKVRGNGTKTKLLKAKYANVSVGKNKTVRAEILTVASNAANRQFARNNIITKGAFLRILLDGEKRLAKATSRPGQSGSIEAVLAEETVIEEKKKPKRAGKAIKVDKKPKEARKEAEKE